MGNNEVIHCIGDSHASFFAGYDEIQPVFPNGIKNKYPFFKAYRLGAVLAYNLTELSTRESGREKLLEITAGLRKGAKLLLCFGEIDCRCHLLKQSYEQGRSLEIVVEECVNRYLKVIDELKNAGFTIIVWNAVPTSQDNNIEYPIYGSETERNKATYIFNEKLQAICKEKGVAFVSLFNKLVTKKHKTRKTFFFDSIHLGQLAMPYALKEIRKHFPAVITGHLNTRELFVWTVRTFLRYHTISKYRFVRSQLKNIVPFFHGKHNRKSVLQLNRK